MFDNILNPIKKRLIPCKKLFKKVQMPPREEIKKRVGLFLEDSLKN
jgi:hypothetical protein